MTRRCKIFQQVTLSPDLKLQQQAFYNLGNTQYRMGELKFDAGSGRPGAMEETWRRRVKSYARAVQIEHERRGRGLQSGFREKRRLN